MKKFTNEREDQWFNEGARLKQLREEHKVSRAELARLENGEGVRDSRNSISGTGFKNREGIQQLLEDAISKKFDVVIAKSISRLGRNMLQSLQIADQLERLQIRLILPEDTYDTETSSTRLMFNLKAALAEEESAKLSERVKFGLQASAREGKVKCSLPMVIKLIQ